MNSTRRWMRWRPVAVPLLGVLLALTPRPVVGAGGQDAGREALHGRVVDWGTGAPLAAAEVLVRWGSASGPVVTRVTTDAAGAYRIEVLGSGRYHFTVERVGYRARTLEVRVGAERRARVSVALELEPIGLEPLAVDVPGRVTTMTDPEGREVSVGRITAARIRQERTLTTDARLITMADVEEAATLGEPDLFRALHRLPGVSTRDDFTAELWTRGADWGETRVYLDGVPLFNPVHGFGILSGISSRSVESILFQPGVRGPSLPEGSAAVVELASRSGRTSPAIEGGIDLSLASAQGWAAAPVGEGGALVSLRRSWADAVARAVSTSDDEQLPYSFWDLHVTADQSVSAGQRVSIGLLIERDAIRGEIPDLLHNTSAAWGNVLATAALEGTLGSGFRHRHRVGVTLYDANVRRIDGQLDSVFSAPAEEPADHAVRYLTVGGEVTPSGAPDRWTLGWDLIRQSARYEGPETWPYSQAPPDLPRVSDEASLLRVSLWGRRRWELSEGLMLDAGLRGSAGEATRRGHLDLSPHVLLRATPAAGWTLAAGVGRATTYAQSPAPVGPRLDGFLQTGRRWILADEDRSPVRSTIATVGAEAWLGERWLASGTLYRRRSDGVLLPDPTPGPLVQRSPLVAGEVTALGVDLSIRRLAGRVTGSFAYSVGRAEARLAGRRVPAPTDRRHVIDATAATRLGRSVRLALAYTWASGAPYTRVLPCTTDACRGVELDRPFQRRAPEYSSLDLVVDVVHRFDGWTFGWFVQARNLLGHDNAVTYRNTDVRCANGVSEATPCPDGSTPIPEDQFVTGIPRLPLIGLRVTF